MHRLLSSCLAVLLTVALPVAAAFPEPTPRTPANLALEKYFYQQTVEIEQQGSLAKYNTAEEWKAAQPELRRQLAEMLGLDPMPPRTPLQPVITGEVKGEGFVVEKLHFQSMPGLYVTGNFYRPEKVEGPLPAILYVCGHSNVVKDGVSLGNKTGYHHHGVWFARHGYACLVIDTLQLGEIRGEHHGTYNLNKWWWVARGYTSAGVEAWNSIRALDYLETRPEVDRARFGVTGRSGGGAYSWWAAALDERIKAAAPTAGITSMRNHVVDGCVEGHCDCMYFVNTYRWDFDRVAALVAPRALLVCNTDKDGIFPIDGVFSVYQSARRIYKLIGAEEKIGLQVAEGPHKDMQPLNTGAFHWFERQLKGADIMATTDEAAKKVFEPQELKVFATLPKDERNTRIDREFVPLAKAPSVPESKGALAKQAGDWKKTLLEKVFRAWPKDPVPVQITKENSISRDGVTMTDYDFTSEEPWRLRIYITHREGLRPEDLELVALNVLDEEGWKSFTATYNRDFGKMIEIQGKVQPDEKAFEQERKMFETFKWAMAYVCPRGVGPLAWSGSDKAQNQRLRRYYLLGQTAASAQVYDIRRAIQALRQVPGFGETRLWVSAHRDMAANSLYAAMFEENVSRVDLHDLPASHASGPHYLNVLRYLDLPQAAAIPLEKTRVVIYSADKAAWEFSRQTAEKTGLAKQFQLRDPVEAAKK